MSVVIDAASRPRQDKVRTGPRSYTLHGMRTWPQAPVGRSGVGSAPHHCPLVLLFGVDRGVVRMCSGPPRGAARPSRGPGARVAGAHPGLSSVIRLTPIRDRGAKPVETKDVDGSAPVSAGDHVVQGAETAAPHAPETGIHVNGLSRVGVPEPDCCVLACRRHRLSVRGECTAVDRACVTGEDGRLGTCLCVPQPERSVIAGRGQRPTVRRESTEADKASMAGPLAPQVTRPVHTHPSSRPTA